MEQDTAPEAGAAFAKLTEKKSLSKDDFKTLALLEAAGQMFYDAMADAAPNETVKKLLARNGQEEMAHAHRLKRVIKVLYDEDFEIPANASNPFCQAPMAAMVINKQSLAVIAEGEAAGEGFYDGWASHVGNDEAAKLLRLNGKEEGRHGERAKEAISLLPN